MKEIKLTKGFVVQVDDEDVEVLSPWNWYAVKGGRSSKYYARGYKNGKFVYMHRLLLKISREFEVDHVDGDSLNNQKSNLRQATHIQNLQNTPKHSNNTSGHKGVTLDNRRNRWVVQIRVNGTRKYLGSYTSKSAAAEAYKRAAKDYHKEFAKI